MKTSLLFTALFVAMSQNVLANSAQEVTIEKIEKESFIQADCPVCQGGPLVTTTTFTISMSSCLVYEPSDFRLEVSNGTVSISPKPTLLDCDSGDFERQYTIVTDKLEAGTAYKIVNPIRW